MEVEVVLWSYVMDADLIWKLLQEGERMVNENPTVVMLRRSHLGSSAVQTGW